MSGIARIGFVLTAILALTYSNIGIVKAIHLVGVTYGTAGKHLPSPPEVAKLYLKYGIGRVRLFDANDYYIQPFRGFGLDITYSIPNAYLANFAFNPLLVEVWFNKYVAPYVSDFVISHIVVGDKMINGIHEYILTVMQTLQTLLNERYLGQVKVTTVLSAEDTFDTFDPPSNATFSSDLSDGIRNILKFLSLEGSPLLVSIYPYSHYIYSGGLISMEYALFTANSPVVHDGPLEYYNLFDAMIDAFYAAMEKLGINNVEVAVGETGWPTCGHDHGTTPQIASIYNQNLIKHLRSGKGTPRKPNVFIQGFIRNMFDETYHPSGENQCYGIMNINKEPKYPLF